MAGYFLVIIVAVLGLAVSLVLASVLSVGLLYAVAVIFWGVVIATYWGMGDDLIMAALAAAAFIALAVMLVVNG